MMILKAYQEKKKTVGPVPKEKPEPKSERKVKNMTTPAAESNGK